MKKLLIAAALVAVSISSFAFNMADVKEVIPLKDGSTVYVFKDGKMGMESRYGRAAYMKEGEVMEAKDGRKILMVGNEVSRMDYLLNLYNIGG